MHSIKKLSFVVPMLLLGSHAHISYLDNGTYTSLSTAWPYLDTVIARTFKTNFECPLLPSWQRLSFNGSVSSAYVGIGIPNIIIIVNDCLDLWVIGAHLIVPDKYSKVDTINSSELDTNVLISKNYIAYKVLTLELTNIRPFLEPSGVISGYSLLSIYVNVTQASDVYLVLCPTE